MTTEGEDAMRIDHGVPYEPGLMILDCHRHRIEQDRALTTFKIDAALAPLRSSGPRAAIEECGP